MPPTVHSLAGAGPSASAGWLASSSPWPSSSPCANRPPPPPAGPPSDRPSPFGALRELLGNPSFVLLVLYFTLPALAGWIVRDWMPAILEAEFGLGDGA